MVSPEFLMNSTQHASEKPAFSVIIATRNRPSLFEEAFRSVAAQTCPSLEIIVIDDGSDERHSAAYRAIIENAKKPVCFHSLERQPQGHGPGLARNSGAKLARGDYLCFLDDDDCWTAPRYLDWLLETIRAYEPAPDLHLSNQAAFFRGHRKPGSIWLEALPGMLSKAGRLPDIRGVIAISADDLLLSGNFSHLNTLVVRRELFEEIGGFDEELRWEEDRDLYLRLIDRAKTILYSDRFVAHHNIPDPEKTANASTALTELERCFFQMRIFERAAASAYSGIRKYARRQLGYTQKRIAEMLAAKGDYKCAIFYARAGLGSVPTLKWTLYTAYIATMACSARGTPLQRAQFVTLEKKSG